MKRTRLSVGPALMALMCALLVVSTAAAQQRGGIAGQVTDSTGGALPGVTVEVNSPAMIGGTQVVFTDGEGRYNAVDLPIGAYTVTFTLPGFSTIVRDGIDIGVGFTANISTVLSVGAVEETVTVTGAAPVVDVQTTRQQRTIPDSELQALPSGNFGLQTLSNVTPGFTSDARGGSDVGGTVDTWAAQGSYRFYHGKPGTRASFNGFRNQYFIGTASGVGYVTNADTIAEMQLEISGMGAEAGSGSVSLNAITKDGSNAFTGLLNGKFSNTSMQSQNLSDEQASFGLTPGELQKVYRASGAAGGPIMQNRLWFYGSIARWGMRILRPGAFFNLLQGQSSLGTNTNTLLYEPDLSRPAADFDWYRTHALRLTYQATERNRFSFFGDLQKNCRCTTGFSGANAIELQRGWDNWPSGVIQFSWTNPVTSRLLLEAGHGWQTINWINFSQPGVVDGKDRSINDRGIGFQYGGPSLSIKPIARTGRGQQYFNVNYVTGSHNVKVGVSTEQGFNDESRQRTHADSLNYGFRNGVPERIDYYATPYFQQERMNMELGLFAQDAWTIDRLTLNLGIRFDYVSMGFPASTLAAGLYVPERTVEELTGVPEWNDINPRLGASYDVFGTGRTAVKVSLGRYNELTRSDLTRQFHPFSSSVSSANRDWDDLNGNFVPDCDVVDFTANGECGAISNSNFGLFRASNTLFNDDILQENRGYTWDFLTEVQHELFQGFSVSVGYNRNWTGAWIAADNVLVGTDDFDEFCFTAPSHSVLPGGGGYEVCGNYDVDPAKFGQVQYEYQNADKFGDHTRLWNGITLSLNGRFPNGVTLAGGFDIGRQEQDHCYTIDEPNSPRGGSGTSSTLTTNFYPGTGRANGEDFCSWTESWGSLADFRLRGSFPLPADFNFAWLYKNLPGFAVNATTVVGRSQIRFVDPEREALNQGGTGPGRLNRSAVAAALVPRDSLFTDRLTQIDLRVTRTFDLSGLRLDTSLDLYNAFNSNSVQGLVSTFGSRFLRPTGILDARLVQLSAILAF